MNKIKHKQVLIQVGNLSIGADLLDTATSHALLAVLPCSGTVRTWGDEIYFPLPLGAGLEKDARDVVEPGELAYWPEGGCIAIGYGPTPASQANEIRLAAPVNIWGLATASEVLALSAVSAGDRVSMELVTMDA